MGSFWSPSSWKKYLRICAWEFQGPWINQNGTWIFYLTPLTMKLKRESDASRLERTRPILLPLRSLSQCRQEKVKIFRPLQLLLISLRDLWHVPTCWNERAAALFVYVATIWQRIVLKARHAAISQEDIILLISEKANSSRVNSENAA